MMRPSGWLVFLAVGLATWQTAKSEGLCEFEKIITCEYVMILVSIRCLSQQLSGKGFA